MIQTCGICGKFLSSLNKGKNRCFAHQQTKQEIEYFKNETEIKPESVKRNHTVRRDS
jgi:hypothetical protein